MSTKSRGDGEIEDEAKLWRVSEDPNTGKKFFWNVVTRQSQWEKPLCLCSRAERARIARQEEQQRNFFQEMEGNIRRKLQQGLFSADVTAPAAMLPAEDETDNTRSWGGKTRVWKKQPIPVPESMESPPGFLSDIAPIAMTGPLCRTISTMDDCALAELSAVIGPDVPTPSRGASPITTAAALPLPPVGLVGVRSTNSRRSAPSNGSFSGSTAIVGDGNLYNFHGLPDPSQPPRRSPAPVAGAKGGNIDGGRASVPLQGAPKGGGGGGSGPLCPPEGMTRRNSTSTIFVGQHDTISDPDRDATIRCVCAVYRAHIIEAEDLESRGERMVGGGGAGLMMGRGRREMEDDFTVFDDRLDEEYGGQDSDSSLEDSPCLDGSPTPLPSLVEITAYYRDVFHRTKLNFDCIILSLVYIERLITETKGALRPHRGNWKSLLMATLVLSSKVWDDLSMWNADFSVVCPSFRLNRINELEVAVLEALRYNVKVQASQYAKYYFHLRSTCVKSGLAGENAALHPLDIKGIKTLEDLSSKLAAKSVGKLTGLKKAVTLHFVGDPALSSREGYSFTDKAKPFASLEEVLSNMRTTRADGGAGNEFSA